MMKRSTLLPAALALLMLCSACSKNIQTTDAVKAGIMEYLTATATKIGLDMSAMEIDVPAVSFEKDHAKATVSIKPKGVDMPGMQLVYNLDRKGDKWVVAGPGEAANGAHGAAAMPGGGTPGGGAPDGPLPAGHPTVPDGPPGGHADPSGQLPAGHPPIGKQQ
ncbi:MAG TPA: hypothetical protein VGN17_29700 [Bryobacteraceae bacterium]|jgi:hypothetical protein